MAKNSNHMRYIYCMFCPTSLKTFGRFKIGITSNMKWRLSQVASELGIPARRMYSLSFIVFFPERVETRLHRWFESARAKMPRHSGHTEWFKVRNFVAMLIFIAYCQHNGKAFEWWHPGIVYLLPLPLDGFLAVLAAFLFQVAAALLILYICFAGLAGVFSTIF